MEKMHFSVDINAPASKVYKAIVDDQLYRKWTAEFNPTSHFVGGWNKGDKILFIGISEEGKREGMVSTIVENIPEKQISIKHLGVLHDDKEITDGPAVEGWAGAMEEYFFEQKGATTTFKVAVDTNKDFTEYFGNTWPKALNKLKEISEN